MKEPRLVWSPPSNQSTPDRWALTADIVMQRMKEAKTPLQKRAVLQRALDAAYGEGFSDA